MKMFVAFASLALVASPAFGQSSGTAAGGTTGGPATQGDTAENSGNGGQPANGERLICRRVEGGGAVGRMGARRVCLTAEQWRAEQRNQ